MSNVSRPHTVVRLGAVLLFAAMGAHEARAYTCTIYNYAGRTLDFKVNFSGLATVTWAIDSGKSQPLRGPTGICVTDVSVKEHLAPENRWKTIRVFNACSNCQTTVQIIRTGNTYALTAT
ncbi:MAG: hypothetical protein WCE21_04190 [Candidatus Babeliales bacterium]